MIFGLSKSFLSERASHESLGCVREYFDAGAVTSVVRRGSELQAFVEGSDYASYAVRITFDEAGITSAECSCPYSFGGWCKHVVAVLLTCMRDCDAVDERPSLDEQIGKMTREQLADLVRRMASEHPHLVERIEHICVPPAVDRGGRKTVLDKGAVRRRVASKLHLLDHMQRSHAYSYVSGVAKEIADEIERAWRFIAADDGHAALQYLEAITEEYVEGWIRVDDSDGALGDLFFDLGKAWTEALLVDELSSDERRVWLSKLSGWQHEIRQYGIDDAFKAAIVAADTGWQDPDLNEILEGREVVRIRPWRVDEDWCGEVLTHARLRILERREQFDAYLRLAGAHGHLEQFLTMLVHIGLTEEAVAHGLELMTETDQAFALACALREIGELEDALRIGEHGLALEGHHLAPLAAWVSELAAGLGKTAGALEAAVVAVGDRPTLESFRRVKALSGAEWPEYRASLLDKVRSGNTFDDDRIDIFLHEGLVEEAVAVADRHPEDFRLLRRVIEAATKVCPKWVVRAAAYQAEGIMDEGRSAYYHYAIDWLQSVRDAYTQMGDETAWRNYLASLKEKHGRKHKLMRLIEERLHARETRR